MGSLIEITWTFGFRSPVLVQSALYPVAEESGEAPYEDDCERAVLSFRNLDHLLEVRPAANLPVFGPVRVSVQS